MTMSVEPAEGTSECDTQNLTKLRLRPTSNVLRCKMFDPQTTEPRALDRGYNSALADAWEVFQWV